MPKRIQRKRTKGWRMPTSTVCVTRPSKWGNPWSVRWDRNSKAWGVVYRAGLGGTTFYPSREQAIARVVELFRAWMTGAEGCFMRRRELARDELRGKNLACYCPLDAPCHADVLLEIANA